MKRNVIFEVKRIAGYIIGFMLFYSPFDLFARAVDLLIPPQNFYSIHEPCFRIPLNYLLAGKISEAGPVSLIAMALLLIVSLLFGPLLCGKLCPAGALTEYLSRLLPDKVKIDWAAHVPVVPIRYGFLIGFLLTTFVGITNHCAYCNFFVFDMLVTFTHTGHIATYSASLIVTFVLWFIVLGLFTRGGRGFCNFLCPVGAASSFFHYLGSFLPKTLRMKIDDEKCVGCGKCAKQCPMRAISMEQNKPSISIHHCIICQECSHHCPAKAIKYSNK